MKHLSGIAILTLAAGLLFAFGSGPAQAAPKIVDSYCSPTGDFCQSVVRKDGRLRANISTFSFAGKYRLCLRAPGTGWTCKTFSLKLDRHQVYQGSIGLSRHFNLSAKGRYTVAWRYGGNQIGRQLHFKKG